MRKVGAALLALGAVTVAASAVAVPTWGAPAKVTAVLGGFIQDRVEVVGLPHVLNPPVCNYPTIAFEKSWSDTVKINSLATAALLSGRKLACAVDGCTGTAPYTYQKGLICSLQ